MKFICCVFLVVIVSGQIYGMTEKQMKSTAGMVKSVCQPKTKVTNAQIEGMHKGEFEDDNKPKCYMKCVFDTLKLMKNGKFDYNSALHQAATLPTEYAEATKATADKCKDSVASSEPCEAAYELAKCWYFANPDYYFFP